MDLNYEVIIIGAGPAGASAANELVKNKIKTLVIEKKKLPRDKPCDGLVMDSVYSEVSKYFGELPGNLFSDPKTISGMKLVFGTKEYGINFSKPAKFVIRKDFDYWLIKQSKTEFLDEMELISILEKKSQIDIVCKKNGQDFNFSCKYLIGADGDTGTVLKCIDPRYYNNKILPYRFMMGKVHYQGSINLKKEWWYSFIDKNSQFGALNLVTQKDGTITIENCVKKGRDFRQKHMNLVTHLKEFYNFEIKKDIQTDIVQRNQMAILGNFYPGKNNILLAGETSGLLRLWAEGIGLGISSGYAAGRSIVSAINENTSAIQQYLPLFTDLQKISSTEWNSIKFLFGYPGNVGDMDPKKAFINIKRSQRNRLLSTFVKQLSGFKTGSRSLLISIKDFINK